ncbi:MAG: hypothetical protein M1818_004435 [Claussenomyces sp. TS43310]|nr:MAG: hypothetical protein M1818_004435 [Claussenomyces sp. TS43310]
MIDAILSTGDLSTITPGQIRNLMQAQLDYDISDQKRGIKNLINERFDHLREQGTPSSDETPLASQTAEQSAKQNGVKKVEVESEVDMGPPKKKRKAQPDSDAKLAAMLQAEENSRSRPSRTGVKKSVVRKKTSPKKKSTSKIKADDDSDLDLGSGAEKKEVNRSGGFHKEYYLSHALEDLVGDVKSSRPQVVKKIWEHIKANGLQDPNDKRQIICDDKLQPVFKQDKVHMFTMNKLLGKHLFPVGDS